jgi:hypothetical protein
LERSLLFLSLFFFVFSFTTPAQKTRRPSSNRRFKPEDRQQFNRNSQAKTQIWESSSMKISRTAHGTEPLCQTNSAYAARQAFDDFRNA